MATAAELDGDDPADLLPLALSRPNEALDRARKVLADDPGLLDASIARQTIGSCSGSTETSTRLSASCGSPGG
jgi:hypothetical protein